MGYTYLDSDSNERTMKATGAGTGGDPDIPSHNVEAVIPGTGATNLGKAEDAAHSSGDVGVMALAVRTDTAAARATTDADYAPLEVDANGRLHAVLSSAEKAEDAGHSSGDKGFMALAVRNDAGTALAGTDLDYIPLGTDASGNLRVVGSGAATETSVAAAAASLSVVDDWDESDRAKVNPIAGQAGVAAGAGAVDALTQRVTHASDDPAVASLSVLDDWDLSDACKVTGETAHDAADAGNPVKIGGYAKAAAPTDVSADGDRVNAWFDRAGRLAVHDGAGTLSVDDGAGSLTVDGTVGLTDIGSGDYETVAASQTGQVLGASGAAGDYLAGVLIVPATTSPGAVSIKDGSGSAITIFTGGATSVSNLVPFFVPLGIKCATNWNMTTGGSVSAIGVGNFS